MKTGYEKMLRRIYNQVNAIKNSEISCHTYENSTYQKSGNNHYEQGCGKKANLIGDLVSMKRKMDISQKTEI